MFANEQEAITAIFIMTIMGAAFGLLIGILMPHIKRHGKVRVFLHDPDTNLAEELWVKPEGNEFVKGKANDARRYILDGMARVLVGSRAMWWVNAKTGTNYRAPFEAESTNADPLLMRLSVSNPQTYHLNTSRNRVANALNANSTEDKWGWVKPAVIAVVLVMALLVVAVIFVAITVSNGVAPEPSAVNVPPRS